VHCNRRSAVVLGVLAAAALLLASAGTATAGVITFDEFPATNNNAALTNLYAGLGVLFDARNSGTWGGNSNGNPGNWGVDGTNGPQFLGNNGLNNGSTYTESIFFATPESLVTFDASRTNGSSPGQMLTANAFNSLNQLVATQTFTLGNINTWTGFSLSASSISRVDLVGTANGFSPFAIDNLHFTAATATPEPGTLVLLGAGLVGVVGGMRRLRKRAGA
jgi:hypothetical protein